jgi:mono/diheme cytochrome c family protein
MHFLHCGFAVPKVYYSVYRVYIRMQNMMQAESILNIRSLYDTVIFHSRTTGVLAALATAAIFAATPVSQAADLAKGKTLYTQRCSTCHGDKGAGDGPIALSLPPEQKPRNLQEGKNKFATDDDKFRELMKKGGAAVGLNMLMPAQSDLNADDVDSLLLFVHSLKK